MSFTTLGLSEPILKAIAKTGYTTPTPIQEKAIPLIIQRKDVLAAAQTGTGKTAGFTLPLLENLEMSKPANSEQKKPHIRALILTPTRELAAQVGENVAIYSEFLDYKSTVVFGGVSINRQIGTIRRGVDILIATPGRLLDLISQKVVDLTKVEILVLDEADRMLDMGFINDIKKVIKIVPKNRQTLLFSATFSKEIKALASGFQLNPTLVEVAAQNTTSERVEQVVYPVDKVRKRALLSKLIKDGSWSQVLVFTRTKHGANKLSQYLEEQGISSTAIHGNKSQSARTKALANFKAKQVQVLVATDIAARGLDIDMLPHVVNFELPNVPEDYVHRIGRTGRAGRAGEAVSLVCVDEKDFLKSIERLTSQKIKKVIIEGFEVDPNIKAEPISMGGRGKRNQPRKSGNKKRENSSNRTPRSRNRSKSRD